MINYNYDSINILIFYKDYKFIMDVTRDNFKELLPLIEKSIKNADYIAFDTEFSGKHKHYN